MLICMPVCISLTTAHKYAGLNWNSNHQHWSLAQWVNMMLSDVSRFSLNADFRWITIRRKSGTRPPPPGNIVESYRYLRGVMVWASIMLKNSTDLRIFESGSATATTYTDKILEPYVHLFQGVGGPGFISKNDNAPFDSAILVDDFF